VLKQRVITAVVLVLALLAALAWSPLVFATLVTMALAIAQAEWMKLYGWTFGAALAASLALGALLLAALVTMPALVDAATVPLAAMATVAWVILGAVLLRSERRGVVRVAPGVSVSLAFVLTVAAWCAVMLFLRAGAITLLSALVVVWLADTAAYFAGRAFGRTKLAPHISPGKTWAGVWGAMIAVIVVALLAWKFWPAAPLYTNRLLDSLGVASAVPMFAALVVLSIVGDLFESLLKRQAGAKDSGHLLPGHGGFYDRIDAMLAMLPPAALFWRWAN
jgi:phosphatidate cytidylyltransferase